MKLSPKTLIMAMLVAAAAFATNVYAQGANKTQGSAVTMRLSGQLNLYGTSTLHNWEMTTKSLQGSALVEIDNGQLGAISGINMILPVKTLKGEKDGMNDNAYDALNADKYKDIRFVLTGARLENAGAGKYNLHATGNLTISGTTKPVTMEAKAVLNADGSVGCTGTYALKMSEFNIDRPSFMFGAMKTGDALTLSYSVVFAK